MTAPAGLEARRAALKLLQAVLWQHRPLDGALAHALQPLRKPEDRGLARAIASHTLRWCIDLDALIDSAMKKPLPADARARLVLRMALAQHLCLGTPAHAVLGTALPLVEAGPRRLVHGVLSTLFRRAPSLPEAPALPAHFDARWRSFFGDAAVADIRRALAREAPLDLSLRDPQPNDARGLMPGHIRLEAGSDVTALPGFADGTFWVQDIAAQLPVHLLGDVQDTPVLDLCAAPGGKTLQLAARGARVTAVDQSDARLQRLRENLARTGLAASTVTADLRNWSAPQPVPAILLDAPCSATGTCRRHPDVLHLRDGLSLDDITSLQRSLLARAADWLAPGGRLIYAVCSLEVEEGEAQARWLAETRPELAPDPIRKDELPPAFAAAATPDGHVRTHPGLLAADGGCDGFFITRFRRNP